jgi:GT2 family glycosyltransferase
MGERSVAVITVTYNASGYIGDFLESLRAVRYPDFHLIVVDCASADGTDHIVEELWPDVTLIRSEENLGFTGGNNLAIKRALAEGFPYVLFLNCDTVLTPDFLDIMMGRIQERRLVVPLVELYGSGGLMDDTAGVFDWRRGVWKDWLHGRPPPPEWQHERDAPMASLCCLLAPASLFEHAGLLDERLFMYYEDFDFLARARAAGYTIRYVPEARISHRKSMASGGGDSPFKLYYATRNRAAIMRRRRTRAQFALFSADFAATRLIHIARYLATGRPALAGAMWRGLFDAYRGRMGRTFPPPAGRGRGSGQVLLRHRMHPAGSVEGGADGGNADRD